MNQIQNNQNNQKQKHASKRFFLWLYNTYIDTNILGYLY